MMTSKPRLATYYGHCAPRNRCTVAAVFLSCTNSDRQGTPVPRNSRSSPRWIFLRWAPAFPSGQAPLSRSRCRPPGSRFSLFHGNDQRLEVSQRNATSSIAVPDHHPAAVDDCTTFAFLVLLLPSLRSDSLRYARLSNPLAARLLLIEVDTARLVPTLRCAEDDGHGSEADDDNQKLDENIVASSILAPDAEPFQPSRHLGESHDDLSDRRALPPLRSKPSRPS